MKEEICISRKKSGFARTRLSLRESLVKYGY